MSFDTEAEQYGALNFGAPFMVSLTFPDASNLDTELERTSFLRLSPEITPSAAGGTSSATKHHMSLSLGLGLL
jgi:hypothetical protein